MITHARTHTRTNTGRFQRTRRLAHTIHGRGSSWIGNNLSVNVGNRPDINFLPLSLSSAPHLSLLLSLPRPSPRVRLVPSTCVCARVPAVRAALTLAAGAVPYDSVSVRFSIHSPSSQRPSARSRGVGGGAWVGRGVRRRVRRPVIK